MFVRRKKCCYDLLILDKIRERKATNWGFGEKERPLERTEVSETMRVWEERLMTEWVELESMLGEGG